MAGHFLLSKDARNFNLRTVDALSEDESHDMFVRLRWNHGGKQVCPTCGTVDNHYVIRGRRQWRCKSKGCGRTFSVTSGTKFADRKLSFKDILRGLVLFISSSKGISAPEFSNKMGIAYATGFVLLQKLRETLWQTRDLTPLSGRVHMDGAHFCGRPRKPNTRNKLTRKWLPPRARLTNDATGYHPNRRIVIVLRQLYPGKGKGASRTIVEFAKGESAGVVNALAKRYIAKGTVVMTDELASYSDFGPVYDHRTVNHNVQFCTKDGVNNNQAESFWTRVRRMVWGTTHRITPHYLAEYANEMAWREDVRRCSQRDKLETLLRKMLRSGRSRWWLGYWQGTHRTGDLEFTA